MSIEMQLQVTASLLRRGESLDRLSTGLTLLGALLGLGAYVMPSPGFWGPGCACALLVLGLWQKYWALRVAFDADLFQHLAASAPDLAGQTASLDAALAALNLQPAERGGRPWSERIAGALGLLRRQALLVAVQALLALAFILASPWLTLAG
ncbi:hypothetical protein PS918_03006 [Pseudomonas fluorescens]|uniref:Transmembrane protein n=1 Tax=Pseudomonas fluorescens TaxID=294 RepID=A0A5E7SRK5_PSEFL|nr:hypothetical protein [Pseudomonas fluorescens]VVP88630.1 hypothetical protein PS918_03006 [Pseudomonas fluorescens]